jgi:hypothetical protein
MVFIVSLIDINKVLYKNELKLEEELYAKISKIFYNVLLFFIKKR